MAEYGNSLQRCKRMQKENVLLIFFQPKKTKKEIIVSFAIVIFHQPAVWKC